MFQITNQSINMSYFAFTWEFRFVSFHACRSPNSKAFLVGFPMITGIFSSLPGVHGSPRHGDLIQRKKQRQDVESFFGCRSRLGFKTRCLFVFQHASVSCCKPEFSNTSVIRAAKKKLRFRTYENPKGVYIEHASNKLKKNYHNGPIAQWDAIGTIKQHTHIRI